MNRSNRNRRRLRLRLLILSVSVSCAAIGCASLNRRVSDFSDFTQAKDDTASVSERAAEASQSLTVSNPPARQIRFDGQEQLLGGANCQCIPADRFRQTMANLLEQQKLRSARAMIGLHPRSAHNLLVHDLRSNAAVLDFIANTLDRGRASSIWADHRTACNNHSELTERFQSVRQQLIVDANSGKPIEPTQAELVNTAETLHSIPLAIEAQRLTASSLVARQRTDEAIAVLVESAELATRSGLPQISSDLWMMACEASLQIEQVAQARSCWKAGVANQLAAVRTRPDDQPLPPIDTVFWEQADRLIHPEDSFPVELGLAFSPWYSRIGIRGSDSTPTVAIPPRVALWSSIAQFQLVTGQPHLATLSIKRAEVDATPEMKPWLQIMAARSLAAQSQTELATTILGTLTGHDDPPVAAAALAALGSIKIQDGAYQQGSGFLAQAFNMQAAGPWPGRLAAKADWANVRLIVGSTQDALPELHAVQNEMMLAGNWQSLCQSLENEAAILESENQTEQAQQIRRRIAEIEQG